MVLTFITLVKTFNPSKNILKLKRPIDREEILLPTFSNQFVHSLLRISIVTVYLEILQLISE